MSVRRQTPGPNQESVWDYPRPPRLEATSRRIRGEIDGIVLFDTRRAHRVLETSHPPVYYVPLADVAAEHVVPGVGTSFCEWKGRAVYHDVVTPRGRVPRAAWSYPDPVPAFAPIRGHLAFYAGALDACFVDDERVTPQPSGFYGGWITSDVVGPFKGEPGSAGW